MPPEPTYRRTYFDPLKKGGTFDEETGTLTFAAGGEIGPGSTYVYHDDVVLAVNVALTAGRPLLVSGEPGSGKSTLARNVAAVLGWRYYKHVVTSRTQARDLLWSFDALRRLGDAQAGSSELLPKAFYVEPEALWWAFSPETAALRGSVDAELPRELRSDARRGAVDPGTAGDPQCAVVLLDEIDKADPDVPNDMLEPLDARTFRVQETGFQVSQGDRQVLVVVTTNGERELPPAFLRRCVTLHLPDPTDRWLAHVARQRFPRLKAGLAEEMAGEVVLLRDEAGKQGLRKVSTAEYLDALGVLDGMEVEAGSRAWDRVRQSVLWKHEARLPPREPAAGNPGATAPA